MLQQSLCWEVTILASRSTSGLHSQPHWLFSVQYSWRSSLSLSGKSSLSLDTLVKVRYGMLCLSKVCVGYCCPRSLKMYGQTASHICHGFTVA